MGEALRLHLERFVLSHLRLRALDLLQHVPQVIGLPPDLGLPGRELGLALFQLLQAGVRIAHRHTLDVGIGIRVQHVALRVGTQQRLGLVLAVQINEQTADLAQHTDRHRRPVHPRARLALTQHFALQDQPALLQLDAEGGKGRQQVTVDGGREFERPLDDRFVRTRAHDVGRRPLAEQEGEGIDDHRFAGAGFAGENVEAWLERQCHVGDHGEIADPELRQHLDLTP